MISMVVGTVLMPASVTVTVGMALLLVTFFFTANACVKRSPSSATIAIATAAST